MKHRWNTMPEFSFIRVPSVAHLSALTLKPEVGARPRAPAVVFVLASSMPRSRILPLG
jgi:hypothetical protein